MSSPAIQCNGLSKRYRIGLREPYGSLRESLTNIAAAPMRRLRGGFRRGITEPAAQDSHFWALKEVSFEVERGEVLGIIGRNGAGKSTLLKILSRITEPTEGTATIRGRVGSLLEVGTGFHAELTGRENTYLNGAILGMKKAEIDRKFDEIVAFAELERFIDTPVKRYSSGMYVRLAFAVAAHLESDILLVDEVLAVGDLAFQKRCMEKMEDVTHQGRTILLVSHNMAAIFNLCRRAVLLDRGSLIASGDAGSVVERYLEAGNASGEAEAPTDGHKYSDDFQFRRVRVLGVDEQPRAQLGLHEGVRLEIEYTIMRPVRGMTVFFRIENKKGICLLTSTDVDWAPESQSITRMPGSYVARCLIPSQYLRPGRYAVDLESSVPYVRWLDRWPRALVFEVVDTASIESKTRHGRDGIIAPVLEWDTRRTSSERHRVCVG
jgi:lipopolysaccharide transport system ATP-binding protein